MILLILLFFFFEQDNIVDAMSEEASKYEVDGWSQPLPYCPFDVLKILQTPPDQLVLLRESEKE